MLDKFLTCEDPVKKKRERSMDFVLHAPKHWLTVDHINMWKSPSIQVTINITNKQIHIIDRLLTPKF